ncbi:N-acetyltransferase [archaeon]|nr:MAG: N-acetyltransferase [archaeon]
MKGQGGGGTARGGGKNRVGGGSVAVEKTKARQTAVIDANVMALREALFNENGKDKDVTQGLAKSFLEYTINDAQYSISFATYLSDDDLDWAFEITKEHMFAIYDACGFGWDNDDKMEELTEKGARFLVVRDSRRNIQGFVHFRFTVQGEVLDQMAGETCLYVMDIHLSSELQRKGLGKHMLVLLELMARREKMSRVSLPVFNGDNLTVAWLGKTGRGFVNDESYAELGFDPSVEVGIIDDCRILCSI